MTLVAVGAVGQGDYRVAEVLERARVVVGPVMRGAVEKLPLVMRRVSGYHLGWWDRYGNPVPGQGGKPIRTALVLAAVRAAGGRDDVAAAGAAAVEFVHNFTLLHDDVMDGDELRRQRATAWSVFGTTDAVLAGDAMQALAFAVLAGDTHPAVVPAATRLAACVIELCEGQSADYALESRADVELAECLSMAEAKTGALLGCACAIGALYGGAEAKVVEALDRFGRELGLGMQLIDDLLGIWGDPAVTGKPAGADLARLKKTLPVVAALTSGTAEGEELAALYGDGAPLRDSGVAHAAELVERAGARHWAQAAAADRITCALSHLVGVFPEAGTVDGLLALAELITRQNR